MEHFEKTTSSLVLSQPNNQPMKHKHSKTLHTGLAQCIIGD